MLFETLHIRHLRAQQYDATALNEEELPSFLSDARQFASSQEMCISRRVNKGLMKFALLFSLLLVEECFMSNLCLTLV